MEVVWGGVIQLVLISSSEALLDSRVLPEADEGCDHLRREGLIGGEGGGQTQDHPGMVLQ
jgi:hypothetical protein